jgi:hypothetical protein
VSWKLTAFKPQLFHGSGRIVLHSRAVRTGPIICIALIDRNIRLQLLPSNPMIHTKILAFGAHGRVESIYRIGR